jgi:hypothetical protein
MTRHDDRCDAPGCALLGTFPYLDGGPGRWCTVHAGGDTTPATVFAWEVDRARGRPTW